MGHTHFLTKRLPNVKTEISLHILAYNMKRVIAFLGTKPLIQGRTEPDRPGERCARGTWSEFMGRIDWKAAVLAGLAAGAVFMMMEMALVALTEGSPWGPPRMIGAIALGREVLPPPATFHAGAFGAAMLIHFALSAVLGIVWGLLFGRLLGAIALAVGAVFGVVVYAIHFYGMTAVFPWFAMARNWITVLSHAVFGLVLAGSYLGLRRRRTPVGEPATV